MKKQSLFALATLAVLLWAQQAGAFTTFPAAATTVCDFMGGGEWVINFTSGNPNTPAGAYTYTSYSREVPSGTNTYFTVKTTSSSTSKMICGAMLKRKTEAAYPGAWNRLGMARSTADSAWYIFDGCTGDTVESCATGSTIYVAKLAASDMKTVSGSGAAQTAVNPVSFGPLNATKQGPSKITDGARTNTPVMAVPAQIGATLAGKRWAFLYNSSFDTDPGDGLGLDTSGYPSGQREMLVEWSTAYKVDYCPAAYPFLPFYYFMNGLRSDGKYVFSYRYRPVVKTAGAGANVTYENADYYEEAGPGNDPTTGSGIFTKAWGALSATEFRIYGTAWPGPATNSASDFTNTYGVEYAKPCAIALDDDTGSVCGWKANQYAFGISSNSDVCPWTAVSNDSWITIDSGMGTGTGQVLYSVAANPGDARSGTITVNARTYTVTETHCRDHSNCVYPDNDDTPTTTEVVEAGSTYTVNQPVPETPYPLCADVVGTWTMHYDGSGSVPAGDQTVIITESFDANLCEPKMSIFDCNAKGYRVSDGQPVLMATSALDATTWAYYETWTPQANTPYNRLEVPDFTGTSFTYTTGPVMAACGTCPCAGCPTKLNSGLVSGHKGCCVSIYYQDSDGDTYGNAAVTTVAASQPSGFVANWGDCNDSNAAVHPGATEVCNGIDDNCDGQTDENVKTTYYRDADSDTYGNAALTTQACSAPTGYVPDSTDCNDSNSAIHPGASDANCDGVDNNCDGATDEGCGTTTSVEPITTTTSVPTTTTTATGAGYIDNHDGTVTDTGTGLMWQQATAPAQGTYTWEQALAYCEGLELAGYTDWRLPTAKELVSLTDITRYNPAINTTYFPDTIAYYYWSSTTRTGNTGGAWLANFYGGGLTIGNKTATSFVRAVRSGQSGSFNNLTLWPVPDTGQTQSYTNTFGEDHDYTINQPSYTKLAAGGIALPPNATTCAMVRDELTGLVWEEKHNKDKVKNYADPNDADNTYTWYDNNSATNGGNAGTPGAGTDTMDFIRSLNNANYGGFSDWRMPTVKELQSIVDYGQDNPAINTIYFPDTVVFPYGSPYYWSSTAHAYNSGTAWSGDFDDGYVSNYNKANYHCVRAVRAGQLGALRDLVIAKSGTGAGAVTSTDGKIDCGSDCTEAYTPGTEVTLTAIAYSVSTFTGWSGGGCSGTAQCVVSITGNVTVTATFSSNIYYQDADSDTYGNAAVTTEAVIPPTGYVADSTDCNDYDAGAHPGAREVCNGIDDDCNGVTDDGLYYADVITECGIGACYRAVQFGCYNGVEINTCTPGTPGTEICDGIDNDCDGQTDEGVKTTYYADVDADTYGNAAVTTQACSKPTGYVANSTDCNDSDSTKWQLLASYVDGDGDTYGAGSVTSVCSGATRPAGYSANSTDCNDSNPNINPGMVEISGNGIDDNCNGISDDPTISDLLGRWTINKDNGTVYVVNINTICNSGSTCLGSSVSALWPGGRAMGAREGDGKLVQFGVFTSAPNEWAYFEGTTFTIGSGIKKTLMFPCNFTQVTAGTTLGDSYHIASGLKGQTFYQDADGDTYGNPAASSYACTGTPTGYVTNSGDCNDSNSAINPAASDANCDGIDNNCNGYTDEDYVGHDVTCGIGACERTVGSTCVNGTESEACTPGTPAAVEICGNGIDDNCNGETDEASACDTTTTTSVCVVPVLNAPSGPTSATPEFSWTQADSGAWYNVLVWSETRGGIANSMWVGPTDCTAGVCTKKFGSPLAGGNNWWWLNVAYGDPACGYVLQPGGLYRAIQVGGCSSLPALTAPTGSVTGKPNFTFTGNGAEWYEILVWTSAGYLALDQWVDGATCTGGTCSNVPSNNSFPLGSTNWWWLNTYSGSCGYLLQPGGLTQSFTQH